MINLLDIVFIIFIIGMAIYGYMKGFVVRLYNLIGTILVIFLSRYLCIILANQYTIYHYDTSDSLSIMIGQVINQLIIFILVFIVLTIIKKLLGMILKPLLLSITHFFSLTAFIDRLLGAIMSIAESLILIYLILLFVIIPFNNDLITNSRISEYLLNIMPEVSESFMNMSECINDEEVTHQVALNMTMSAYDIGFMSDDDFNFMIQEIMQSDEPITLSNKEYEKLNNILNELDYSQSDIENILNNIHIGETE